MPTAVIGRVTFINWRSSDVVEHESSVYIGDEAKNLIEVEILIESDALKQNRWNRGLEE